MCRMSRLAPALLLLATTGSLALAADPVPGDSKSLDKSLTDSLRDIHNYGADLYNQAKDYAGAYRVYEGALKTVRPLLGHRAATQKAIDVGLATAAAETDPARKAFLLHETIEKIRADLKGEGTAPQPAGPKEPIEPKKSIEPKKPEPKKPAAPNEPQARGGPAEVSGTVTYQGKPLATGTLTLVSLDLEAPRVFVSGIKEGKYAVKTLPAGTYIVTISAEQNGNGLLPAKYATTDTSGLRVEVKMGQNNTFAFDLK